MAVMAVMAATALVAITGCTLPWDDPGPPEPVVVPCGGSPAASVDLGNPYPGFPPALFETNGDPVYIAAHYFSRGLGVTKNPKTDFLIGPVTATPPTYDAEHDTASPLTVRLTERAQRYVRADLPAGRYWLWSTKGAGVDIVSCTSGGVTGTPAPPSHPFVGPSPPSPASSGT